MMVALANPELEKAVQRLGYSSVVDFARIQAQAMYKEKLIHYQDQIMFYERKYGMNFEEFRQRVVNQQDSFLSKFGIIEKEDDDFEWETAIELSISLNRTLNAIKL